MSETLGVDLVTANTAVSMFELGGFIGALVAGWGSDKLFNGNRGPMNLIFAAGILLSVGSLWLMPFASYVMQAACFFTTGFFVFGPQMLIGMAAAECSHKEAAGAATGFVGLFAYLGASLSGWPLAKVLEIWHWTGFFCGHRHRGGDLRAIAVAISERSGPTRDPRSVIHLTFLR